MRRTTAKLWLPALIIGSVVTTYWLIAFWAALTTPIRKGPAIKPPWEPIDLFRDPGLSVAWPLLFSSEGDNPAILLLRSLDWGLSLALVAFAIGLGIALVVLLITRIGWCLVSRHGTAEARM